MRENRGKRQNMENKWVERGRTGGTGGKKQYKERKQVEWRVRIGRENGWNEVEYRERREHGLKDAE